MIRKIKKSIDQKKNSKNPFWILLNYLVFLFWKIKTIFTRKIFRVSKKVFSTKKYNCFPDADVEIHTLTSHQDLKRYLLAIKSFLRFYNKVAVVVHDDGSLTNSDKEILKDHISGIKIISFQQAENQLVEKLNNYKKIQYYYQRYVISKQLFDYALLAKTEKIISLDSDILFFKSPTEVIKWIENGSKELISNFEEYSIVQEQSMKKYGLSYTPGFNNGFFCYYRDIIDLAIIEELLEKFDGYNFCTNQDITSVLINRNSEKYNFKFFPPDTYQTRTIIKGEEPIFRHYLASSGLYKQYSKDIKKND